MTHAKTGERRLVKTLARWARAIRADPGHQPDAPEPATDWERLVEERLRAVEKQLSNQNRLLLFSLVAIVADAIAKVVTHNGP